MIEPRELLLQTILEKLEKIDAGYHKMQEDNPYNSTTEILNVLNEVHEKYANLNSRFNKMEAFLEMIFKESQRTRDKLLIDKFHAVTVTMTNKMDNTVGVLANTIQTKEAVQIKFYKIAFYVSSGIAIAIFATLILVLSR